MSWPSSPGWKQWTTGPTGSPIRPEARGSSRGDSWALMVYPLQHKDRRGGPEGSWGPAAGGVPLVFKHSRQMKSSEIRGLGSQLLMMQLHFPLSGPPHVKNSTGSVWNLRLFSLALMQLPLSVLRNHFLSLTEEIRRHFREVPVRSSKWVSCHGNHPPAASEGIKRHTERPP